ncbi:MAG TPA: methyltransferase domain-containing protein [Mycobacterium sp.]|nr:methyltransferase domain-containing protein [Mycobacterium sp.]
MAHDAQRAFFRTVRTRFPYYFIRVKVLDCGSLNVNGSLREFFDDCDYLGVDVRPGPGVDHVGLVHDLPTVLPPGTRFDTIVSANMLEHDEHWDKSLRAMYKLLRPDGLLVVSAPGTRRPEHGTIYAPDSDGIAQGGNGVWGTSPEHYRAFTPADFTTVFTLKREFSAHDLQEHQDPHPDAHDVFFWGFKALR